MKATLHWVSASDARTAHVRLYDRLFVSDTPGEGDRDWRLELNPDSLKEIDSVRIEPSLAGLASGERVQFERLGYFSVDPDSEPDHPVFNRVVGLKDQWAKIEQRERLSQEDS